MSSARFVLLLVATLLPLSARAQDRPVYPGDRVRITDDRTWTALVQWVTPDSIRVVEEDVAAQPRSLALDAIGRLEVYGGRKSKARAFLVGGVIGAAAFGGGAWLVSRLQACDGGPANGGAGQTFCERIGAVAIGGTAIVGFPIGGAVGAILARGERWVVATEPLRTGFVEGPGVRIGMILRF